MLAVVNEEYVGTEVRTEMDSHVDTFVVGSNSWIIYDHTKTVNMTGYDDHQQSKEMKTDCSFGI